MPGLDSISRSTFVTLSCRARSGCFAAKERMHQILKALLLAACSYLAYTILADVFVSVKRSRRARQLGCAPPKAVPQPWWDLLGVMTLTRTARMAKQKMLGDHFLNRHDILSELAGYDVKTASLSILGKSILYTDDPKNIQAILATQFKDFSLGPVRRGCFFPLLGNGIVSLVPRYSQASSTTQCSFLGKRAYVGESSIAGPSQTGA